MRRSIVWTTALFLAGFGQATAQVDATTRLVSYGPDSLNVAELQVPDGSGPFPVVMLLHGGCWSARLGSIDGMRPLAEELVQAGVATWNVEYRRVGHPGGGWPGTYHDLSAATDYLRHLSGEFPIDTARVVVAGHSSGGYFAGWVAGRGSLPSDSPLLDGPPLAVSGVAPLDAFLDPFVIDSRGVSGAYYCRSPMLTALVGGDPEVATANLEQVSPIELLPYGVAHEVVISSRRYPYREGEPLADGRTTHPVVDYPAIAKAGGDPVAVTVVQDAGHFSFTDPETEAGLASVAAILRLLGLGPR